jgi:hypothetical protein
MTCTRCCQHRPGPPRWADQELVRSLGAVTHHRIAAGVPSRPVPPFQHRTGGGNAVSRTDEADVIVGAGTHLDTHTAAICDARGRLVSQLQVPATAAGYGQLLAWANAAAYGQAGCAGDRGHPPLRAGPGPAPGGSGPAGIRDRQHPARRQAPGGQERPHRCHPRSPGAAGPARPAQMRADGDREALRLLMAEPGQRRPVLQDRPHCAGISPGHCARRATRADPSPPAGAGHEPARPWPARRALTARPGYCTRP